MTVTPVPPWPVGIITGFLGSGKTTLIRNLLTHEGMADTMVIVNEFGDLGIDHTLIAEVHEGVVLLRGGCLCCGLRQDLARTLQELHLSWRAGRCPAFARIIVETSGVADPRPVLDTIASHPLVCDAFVPRGVTTLVDAEHGEATLGQFQVSRYQVAAANQILISKPDRVPSDAVAALQRDLSALNPVASFGLCHLGDAQVHFFDVAAQWVTPASVRAVAVASPVPAMMDFQTITLHHDLPLSWPAVQKFLAPVLDRASDGLLRAKGLLNLRGSENPIVFQALNYTVYRFEKLNEWPGENRESVLVLISDRQLPAGLADAFRDCAA